MTSHRASSTDVGDGVAVTTGVGDVDGDAVAEAVGLAAELATKAGDAVGGTLAG